MNALWLVLLSVGARAAAPKAAEPLQPLLSVISATPYLHSAMAAQMDQLPWKTDEANQFLGSAAPGTLEGEARLVMGALLSRSDSFERDYKQVDRALGEPMSHGLRLRAGYFGRDLDLEERIEASRSALDIGDPAQLNALKARLDVYFDQAVAAEVPTKKVIDGRKSFQWQAGVRPFKPRGPAVVVPLSSRRRAQ